MARPLLAAAFAAVALTISPQGQETLEVSSPFEGSDERFAAVEATALLNVAEVNLVVISQNMANKDFAVPWSTHYRKLKAAGISCAGADIIVIATQENGDNAQDFADDVFQGCPMGPSEPLTFTGESMKQARISTYMDENGKSTSKKPSKSSPPAHMRHFTAKTIWTRTVVKTDIGFFNFACKKFKQRLIIYSRWQGANAESNPWSVRAASTLYLGRKFGGTKCKGILTALLGNKQNEDASFVVASGHLPMNGKDKATRSYGLQDRVQSWTSYMDYLKQQSWWDDNLPIVWTGDSNFRIESNDANGEQLEKLLDAKQAPFQGWWEPSLPRSYTCRYRTKKYIEKNTKKNDALRVSLSNKLDECRTNLNLLWALDWSNPQGKSYANFDAYSSAIVATTADPLVCTDAAMEAADKAVMVKNGKPTAASIAGHTFCGCGSVNNIRPLGFCDRILTKLTPTVKARYNAYESVFLHENSDHNAVAGTLKLLLAKAPSDFLQPLNVVAIKDMETKLAKKQAKSGMLGALGHVNLLASPAVQNPEFGANTRRKPLTFGAATTATVPNSPSQTSQRRSSVFVRQSFTDKAFKLENKANSVEYDANANPDKNAAYDDNEEDLSDKKEDD